MERTGHRVGGSDTAAEWTRFEGRLADRIAVLGDDDGVVHLEVMVGIDDDDLGGEAPFVQFVVLDESHLRAEVAGNHHLDERLEISEEGRSRLIAAGWLEPDDAHPDDDPDLVEHNFWVDAEPRDADRVARMAVTALRDVFGCPHPSFVLGDLDRSGYLPPPSVSDGSEAGDGAGDEAGDEAGEVWGFPTTRPALQELIDRSLSGLFADPLEHDDDGDLPILCGEWMVTVRAADGRAAVELTSELVIEPDDQTRLGHELEILNRTHSPMKFYRCDDAVVMEYVLIATPFVGSQLRTAVDVMGRDLQQIADGLISRVGGRTPMQVAREHELAQEAAAAAADRAADEWGGVGSAVPGTDDVDPALIALGELLHIGDVDEAEVSTLFDHDRHRIVVQLVALRTGRQGTAEHDVELVLHLLRRGLRFAVNREARGGRPAERVRSQQLSLLAELETESPSLDAGEWGRDVG